jgi:hypothetical protein
MDFLDSATATELTLSLTDATDPLLAVPPDRRIFGSDDAAEVSKGSLRLRIGDRPVVRNLKRLFAKLGKALPPELEVLTGYHIWLIAFGVGILRESGFGAVQRFGFSVAFPDKPHVTVIDLLPQTRFVKKFGAELRAEASLGVGGSARLPESVAGLLSQTDALSADATLFLSTTADLVGTLRFSVFSPTVHTIGIGSRRAEWLFEREDLPLLGDQHMFATVLVPKVIEELDAAVRLYATVRTFGLIPCNLGKALPIPISLA